MSTRLSRISTWCDNNVYMLDYDDAIDAILLTEATRRTQYRDALLAAGWKRECGVFYLPKTV